LIRRSAIGATRQVGTHDGAKQLPALFNVGAVVRLEDPVSSGETFENGNVTESSFISDS
jgi:hypothetical protein